MEAAHNSHLAVVELLIAEGADVDQQERDTGLTALHVADGPNDGDIEDVLLDNGAETRRMDLRIFTM